MTQPSLRDFISRIVPWPAAGAPGAINVHWKAKHSQSGHEYWGGVSVTTADDFVGKVDWALQRQQKYREIYFCLSMQGRSKHRGDGKPGVTRSQADALSLRSIWLDIDVKDPPNGYTDLNEAKQALAVFLQVYKLQFPTAIVASGGGMHVYWTSDRDLSPEEWRPYAEGLREAAVRHGLRCDGGVTIDSARILRVPGTVNNKINGNPRPVQLLHLEPADLDFPKTLGALALLAPSAPSGVTAAVTSPFDLSAFVGKQPPAAFAKLDKTESLGAGIEHKHDPLDPTPIFAKDGCPYFRDALKTHGKDAGQGLWMLTVLASTFWINSEVAAHELSNGHPGYKADETAAMIARKEREKAQRGLGWPSCAAFEREGAAQCKGCPHRGKIRSPINLSIPTPPAIQLPITSVPVGDNPVHELRTLHRQGLSLHELMAEFNKRFAVVRQGQEVVVAWIAKDEVQTFKVVELHRMFADLCLRSPKNSRLVEVSHEWFGWSGRRQFLGRGILFDPGGRPQIDDDYINLWRGFPVAPKPGNWSLMRDHILHVICSGNQTHFDYLIGWLAYSVQKLGKPVGVAVALRGAQGAGKGILARTFGSIFGKHYAHITNADHLTGHFNATVGTSLFVFLDEAIWAADRKGENVLKALITEPKLQVEAKYRDPIMVENRLRIMVASNSDWFVPIGLDDRRWFVLDVADTYAGTGHEAYWNDLYREIAAGGTEAMFADLLNMNLTGFNIRAVPRTAAKMDQQTRGLKGTPAWLHSVLHEGKIQYESWQEDGLTLSIDVAYEHYCSFIKQRHEHHPHDKPQWSKDVRKLLAGCVTGRKITTGTGRTPCLAFSALTLCRKTFAAKIGLPELDWDEFESATPNTTPLHAAEAQPAATGDATNQGLVGHDGAAETPTAAVDMLMSGGLSSAPRDTLTRAIGQAEADLILIRKLG